MATTSRHSDLHDDPKAAVERRLLAERDALEVRQRDGHSPGTPPETHVQPAESPLDDVATDLEFRSREAVADRLAFIAAALERLAAGTYGACEDCGEPIAERRLELDPAVATCVECRAAAEGPNHRTTL